MAKIRVFVVDDSTVVRQVLTNVLQSDPGIEVIGAAPDPFEARDKIVTLRPDVITLDVEMPKMDGITFLRKLMERFPVPTIMVSGVTPKGCALALEAMEIGAIDVIEKPVLTDDGALQNFGIRLIDQVKAAAMSKRRIPVKSPASAAPSHAASAGAKIGGAGAGQKGQGAHLAMPAANRRSSKMIAIGASTGGTEALKTVLERMPPDCPPILIVQHMPGNFTRAFSERLNNHCAIEVKEAENGMELCPGRAVIANGNLHLMVKKSGLGWVAETRDGPLVCRHKPSVEVLFNSFARHLGSHGVGAILTGMGRDGADGLKAMRDAGARTVAQDEKTCVVFGMPKEAIKAGAAEKVVPLDKIADTLLAMI